MMNNYWEDVYKHHNVEELPWFSQELDEHIRKFLNKHGIGKGTFLDLGTGPGTQAIELVKMGFDVTATDISPSAIEKAKKRAEKEEVKIRFLVDDILNTKLESKQFDFIFDRGVFHSISPEERNRFVKTIRRIIKDDGIYFMECFSTKTSGSWGPFRFTKQQIKDLFSQDFEILSIADTSFPGPLRKAPKTLFNVMKPKTSVS